MRVISCLSVLVACASAAAVTKLNARANYVVKEEHFVPSQWTKVSDADPDHVIRLSIGLKQSEFDELERHLYEVSDPDHVRYGQHLTSEEVNELAKPAAGTDSMVHSWLAEYGIDTNRLSYSAARDWIHLRLPISEAEMLLDTKYSIFRHEGDGSHLVRTSGWSLPSHLHEHIDTIAPTNQFARAKPQVKLSKRSKGAIPQMADSGVDLMKYVPPVEIESANGTTIKSACNFNAVTPKCLRTLYGTINYKPKSAGTNKVGINNFLNETQNRSDIALFLSRYRPNAVPYAQQFKIKIFQGGQNKQTQLNTVELAQGKDLEGNLDGDTVLGISYPTPLTSFNTGGMPPYMPDLVTPTDTNEPYLAWVNHVLAMDDGDIPQVITSSYGDDEQTVPLGFAKRVCQQYAALGARGVTLLFATGDAGVGSDGMCFSNDPTSGKTRMFLPTFSAACPYITAVGGTKNYPEVVAYDSRNGYSPGGGFSNYFARPKYQDAAVSAYVSSLGSEYAGLYNKTGRAYPDIAAQSQSFVTGWNGSFVLLDGTSAATPAAAGVLALVNDALITAGKPVLGFMNPWLYKKGHTAFTDITSGSTLGCSTNGFPAQSGWDAASGWGSPNFQKIVAALGA